MEMTTELKKALCDAMQNDSTLADELFYELNSWNGFHADDEHFLMTDIDNFFERPSDIMPRMFYGYDEYYKDEYGHHTEAFNPNRDYFYFNGYGNLVSTDEPTPSSDYIDEMIDEIERDNFSSLPSAIEDIIAEYTEE